MFGQVGLISALELTQAALVGPLTLKRKNKFKSYCVKGEKCPDFHVTKPILTTVHEHVPLQTPFVRGHVAALRAAVDLLVGVQMPEVLLELHGVERDKGAEVAAELFRPCMTEPLVLEKDCFIGARKIAL